jgi:allantoinase
VTDLIIRGGTIVTSSGVGLADLEVDAGRITAVAPHLDPQAEHEIDASGLHILPGGIDSHVHFNEPGRTGWETIANGSTALAAGGYTTFVDMPLNSVPVTVDATAFDVKLEAARRSSLVDFGLWGGLVPGNVDRLDELWARGVIGFKAFMCPSGIEEFPACDQHTLREGMKRIARLRSILLVHAEDPRILNAQAQQIHGTGSRDFALSRPPEAELEAISQVIGIARETGCRLHIVHVSTARGVELISQARVEGVDVTGETCPHYLLYTEDDLHRLGGIGKCFPVFRTAGDRDRLWRMLTEGALPMVVSDHSPSTIALKQADDFFKVWGGISGCQSTRQLLLADGRLDLPEVVAITSTNIAQRFELGHKGDIAPGFDADLWIVDLSREDVVRREDLLYRNPFSVHEGQRIRGRTIRTLVRGQTVFAEHGPVTPPVGRFIRPGAGS